MDPSKLIEWLKLSPRYLFVIALTSGFLLFGPADILEKIGVKEFIDSYRKWVGLIFLFFSSLYLVAVIGWIQKILKEKGTQRAFKKMGHKRLKNLTTQEKQILSYYIIKKTRTQTLPFNNGVVSELEKFRIIYRASNISKGGIHFSYNIQPWAWEYLNKHPELLEINEQEL